MRVNYLSLPEPPEGLLFGDSEGVGLVGAPLPSGGGEKFGRFPLGWVEHGTWLRSPPRGW